MTKSFTTPMAKARGLGSVHHGSDHWWAQRVTAISLVPLGLWFVYAVCNIHEMTYIEVMEWFALPWNAALLTLFVLASLYHGALGWQVIVEDYFQTQGWKTYAKIKIQIGSIGLAVLAFFFILRIVITGTHS
jgi:succinate dehydrogenase / fumarate reductase, membrane anchor subunit